MQLFLFLLFFSVSNKAVNEVQPNDNIHMKTSKSRQNKMSN